ncbi:DUF4112 domain-containing protein [Candidatus Peregrinibacteria bacterium]|nr:DUF4112 domain-containing protein [Candidatus Peregrinibacteria bacterium]
MPTDESNIENARRRRLRKTEKSPKAHDPEIEAEEDDVESATKKVLQQTEILDQLRAAKNAEARVRTFAKIMDTYGVEAILGLFEGAGDAATSVLSGLYLMREAGKAGLSKTDFLKIAALQAADFFIGAIPIIGDIGDFVFQANKLSIPLFRDKTDELVREARAAGVSEDAIAKITESAEKLPRLADHIVNIDKAVNGLKKAA